MGTSPSRSECGDAWKRPTICLCVCIPRRSPNVSTLASASYGFESQGTSHSSFESICFSSIIRVYVVRTENTTCRWIFLDISFNLTLTRTVAGCRKTCIQRDKGQRQWRYLKLPNGRQTHLVFRALPPAKPAGLVALVDVDSDPHSLRGWSNTDSFPNSNPFRPTRSDTPMT